MVRCPNPGCISNTAEPARSRFIVTRSGLRCHYCDWLVTKEIAEHIL